MRSTFGNIIGLIDINTAHVINMNFLSERIKEATGYEFDAELGLRSVRPAQNSLKWIAENVCFTRRFCVEVLRPSQPNGVMSSAVSLPNHTFTGQA